MPIKPPTFRARNQPTRKQLNDDYEERRRAAKPWRKWYCAARWLSLRASQLRDQPLCQHCLEQEPQKIVAATVVHHVRRHDGDPALFYDRGNVASLCVDCHDGPVQEREKRGEPWTPGGPKTLDSSKPTPVATQQSFLREFP